MFILKATAERRMIDKIQSAPSKRERWSKAAAYISHYPLLAATAVQIKGAGVRHHRTYISQRGGTLKTPNYDALTSTIQGNTKAI